MFERRLLFKNPLNRLAGLGSGLVSSAYRRVTSPGSFANRIMTGEPVTGVRRKIAATVTTN